MRSNYFSLGWLAGRTRTIGLLSSIISIGALACLLTIQTVAQVPVPPIGSFSMHQNDDGTYTINLEGLGQSTHWVPHLSAPFSGIYEGSSSQTLPNGAHVNQNGQYERLYRDSLGRTRRDRLLNPTGDEKTGLFLFEVYDPVAGFQYVFDDQNHIAHRAPLSSDKPKQPPFPVVGYSAETDAFGRRPEPNTTREYFKDQFMEGVPVVGRRVTIIEPAGFQGSNSPFTLIDEQWICPELDVQIIQKRSDSRGSEHVWRITHINRSEPDASLFRVPEGYTIVDESGGFTIKLKRPH